ncbi:MAG TPA: hypothetical protein VK177_06065 [Flavobacteriales bacterium]|nr:hypothetical protein [Flavobacteriales bacterium]
MGYPFHKITHIQSSSAFNAAALEIFRLQANNCEPYKRFLSLLGINALDIQNVEEIPFLPIEFFKTQRVYCSDNEPQALFTSSKTTGTTPSTHYVANLELYRQSILDGFGLFFGNPQKYAILGLLPGYMERKESSLVYMVNYLQELSGHELNGNFLDDFASLKKTIDQLESQKQPTLLFGVSYALLDFGNRFPTTLHHTSLIETGGMKGKRKELTRHELHDELKTFFGDQTIASEYGMTELLSQAWYDGKAFKAPPWMKVVVRGKNDPLDITNQGSGGLNVIDLANVFSCSFIATGDAGTVYADGSFNVHGRLDHQDARGCNLLYEES